MRVLALDLGASLGWAIVEERLPALPYVACGTVKFEGARPARLVAFRDWLVVELADYGPSGPLLIDVVAYERPFCRGLHATRSLWGMAAIVEELTERRELPCLDPITTEIKKYATGKGHAPKEIMIEVARRYCPQIETEHEADAVILGLYVTDKAQVDSGGTGER